MVRTGCRMRALAAAGLVASLAACASTSQTQWAPREGANLAADRGACETEARAVDMNSPDAYSGRYGAAAAMAGRMDRSDMRGGGADRVFNAIVDACMTRTGWVQTQ